MASGSVSAARAAIADPDSRSKVSAVFRTNDIINPWYWPPRTNTINQCLCRRHRLFQVLRDLVEEARGGEPALIGADQQRKVLGHVAGLDGIDADLLHRKRELGERLVIVQ